MACVYTQLMFVNFILALWEGGQSHMFCWFQPFFSSLKLHNQYFVWYFDLKCRYFLHFILSKVGDSVVRHDRIFLHKYSKVDLFEVWTIPYLFQNSMWLTTPYLFCLSNKLTLIRWNSLENLNWAPPKVYYIAACP